MICRFFARIGEFRRNYRYVVEEDRKDQERSKNLGYVAGKMLGAIIFEVRPNKRPPDQPTTRFGYRWRVISNAWKVAKYPAKRGIHR